MKKIRKDLIYMKKLKIVLKNGRCVEYQKEEYDSWYYDGNAIILKKAGYLVSVYSLNNIICAVEVEEVEKD